MALDSAWRMAAWGGMERGVYQHHVPNVNSQ